MSRAVLLCVSFFVIGSTCHAQIVRHRFTGTITEAKPMFDSTIFLPAVGDKIEGYFELDASVADEDESDQGGMYRWDGTCTAGFQLLPDGIPFLLKANLQKSLQLGDGQTVNHAETVRFQTSNNVYVGDTVGPGDWNIHCFFSLFAMDYDGHELISTANEVPRVLDFSPNPNSLDQAFGIVRFGLPGTWGQSSCTFQIDSIVTAWPLGDASGDGTVNNGDIPAFVLALTDPVA